MIRTFDIPMEGSSMPLVTHALARAGHLRIFVQTGRLIFCVAFGPERPLVSLFLRWALNWNNGGALVLAGDSYGSEWVYEIVRRTTGDMDKAEYEPFMERVRECEALNVTLRPYQQRAVAWMLSRELSEPLNVYEDMKWAESDGIAARIVDAIGVQIEGRVVVNLMGKVERESVESFHREGGGTELLRDSSPSFDSAIDAGGRGGLLCDEMGLGKTVELMQLVACNKMAESTSRPGPHLQGELEDTSCPVCCTRVYNHTELYLVCAECEHLVHERCGAICFSSWSRANFVCSKCCEAMSSVFTEDFEAADLPRSRATIVVIPTSILHQWKTELEKHVRGGLNIIVFRGLKETGYIRRQKLLEADVILTTYEALASDVAAFKAFRTERKSMRHARKYSPTPIPLLAIHWHRLALDESQMLGSLRATQAAEMAGFFHATYRWCVTGTPIHRVAQDAAAMLQILRIRGGSFSMDWLSFLKPSELLVDKRLVSETLRKLIWRSWKEDVEKEELDLPSQTTEVVYTSFGPVEKYHFGSLHDTVKIATSTFTQDQSERALVASNDLLTMLRQACCHPQIGVSGRNLMSHAARTALGPVGPRRPRRQDAVKNALKRAESPLDMNEVLDALVGKAKAECEEALRLLVAASNGLAAVFWLQHSLLPSPSADIDGLFSTVQLYRATLLLAEENKNLVRLDDIQKMHILFNLHEALNSVVDTKARLLVTAKKGTAAERSLFKLRTLGSATRDAELKSEIDDLKQKYIAEARALLTATQAGYEEQFQKLGDEPLIPLENEDDDVDDEQMETGEFLLGVDEPRKPATEAKKKVKAMQLQWWHLATASLLERDSSKQDQFVNRVIQKLVDAVPGGGLEVPSMANRLSSLHSFSLVVEPELRKLQRARIALKQALLLMPGSVSPTPAQVAESGQCKECREFGTGPTCLHCRTEGKLTDVEKCLYLVRGSEQPDFETFGMSGVKKRESVASWPGVSVKDAKALVSNVTRPKDTKSTLLARNQGGLRFQSEVEIILKSMAGALRSEKDQELNRQVSEWFERLEALKKEHTEAKRLFESQRSLLARMDEVNMAVMRFSVLGPDEDLESLTEEERRHRLPRESLPALNAQFSGEKKVTEAEFRSKRGSLVYLKGLQRSAKREANDGTTSKGISAAVQNCAICLMEFNETVTSIAVLGCGHVFCCDCIRLLITRSDVCTRVSSVQCPTCRVRCLIEEINFTVNNAKTEKGKAASEDKTAQSEDEESDGASTKQRQKKRKRKAIGSSPKTRKLNERLSTFYDPNAAVIGLVGAKASAIVRTLRGIWQNDPDAKVLVFSEWQDVLNLISRALDMNGIRFMNGGGHTASTMRFSAMVDSFKTNFTINVLLLPLRRAGAGLNLTEATHVILVEPCMNVSLEAQAIGRVHRIGQTRETFVHRVIIRDTIEEEILALGDEYRTRNSQEGESKVEMSEVLGAIHSVDEPVS